MRWTNPLQTQPDVMSRRKTPRRRATRTNWILCTGIAAVLAVSACSQPPSEGDAPQPEQDSSPTATLDHKNGIMSTPLSQYELPSQAMNKLNYAYALTETKCLNSKGFQTPAPVLTQADATEKYNNLGNYWGVWSVERAGRLGFQLDFEQEVQAQQTESTKLDDARTKCLEENDEVLTKLMHGLPISTNGNPNSESITDRLSMQALSAAEKTQEHSDLHEEYDECLRKKGYTPATPTGGPDGSAEWGLDDVPFSEQGTPSEQEIQAALASAHCFTDTGIIQKIGNLRASFEAPLIKKHQAELNARVKEIEEIETRLDDHIKKYS